MGCVRRTDIISIWVKYVTLTQFCRCNIFCISCGNYVYIWKKKSVHYFFQRVCRARWKRERESRSASKEHLNSLSAGTLMSHEITGMRSLWNHSPAESIAVVRKTRTRWLSLINIQATLLHTKGFVSNIFSIGSYILGDRCCKIMKSFLSYCLHSKLLLNYTGKRYFEFSQFNVSIYCLTGPELFAGKI